MGFDPGRIVQHPVKCVSESAFQCLLGPPGQFALHFRGVDRVAVIVPFAVVDKLDALFARTDIRVWREFVEHAAHTAYEVEVGPFLVRTDIVPLPGITFLEYTYEGARMVFHIKPVPHVAAAPIYRDRLAAYRIESGVRNKLFRELPGAVVIG